MKTINEIRRSNLEVLIEERGSLRAFAEYIEKSPAQVSQWRNASVDSKTGKPRVVGDATARYIEEKVGKQKGWMDSSHGIEAKVLSPVPEVHGTMAVAPISIKIPLLNVTASMGNGSDVVVDELALETITIHQQWADRVLRPYSNTRNLAFIHAIGDSMSPTFSDGDILLVDTWDKSVTADKIYVIEAHDRLFIKRVRQRIDGAFEISSDNPAVKTVDVLNGDHQLKVKGRVVWVWNGKKI